MRKPLSVPLRNNPSHSTKTVAAIWAASASVWVAHIAVIWWAWADGKIGADQSDLVGHAEAAAWLQTLPLTEWAGWAWWSYSGQAIGVDYAPGMHALLRFTDPVHGQFVAMAVTFCILLPWATLRLTKAVGYNKTQQQTALAVMSVFIAHTAARWDYVVMGAGLRGTHGSWNYIAAVCLGMFAAAWAAENKHPVKAGAVAGAAVLFNISAALTAPVVVALAVTNKTTSTKQKLVWLGNATVAAVAVAGWYLIPFTQRMLAGQWQHWPVTLGHSLSMMLANQPIMIFAVVAGAAVAARRHDGAKRLSIAGAAGAGAMLLAAAAGLSRPERFATLALLAAVAAAGAAYNPAQTIKQQATPANIRAGLLGVATVTATYVAVWGSGLDGTVVLFTWDRYMLLWLVLPLTWAVLQLRKPKLPAQVAILVWVALVAALAPPLPNDPAAAAARQQLPENVSGTVMVSHWWGENQTEACDTRPLRAALENNYEPVRIIDGLYKESSPSAEFLHTARYLQHGYWDSNKGIHKPGWVTAWTVHNKPVLNTSAAAEAIGADWHAACRSDGQYTLTAVNGTKAEGVTPAFYPEHDRWRHAAVNWWLSTTNSNHNRTVAAVPVHSTNPYPGRTVATRPAGNVTAEFRKNQITVTAGEAGWVWIKTSHDPWWTADTDSTIHKGGPGHIILQVDKGRTVLTWQRPDHVRNTTIAVTAAAALWIAAATWIATARRRQLYQKHRRLKTEAATTGDHRTRKHPQHE